MRQRRRLDLDKLLCGYDGIHFPLVLGFAIDLFGRERISQGVRLRLQHLGAKLPSLTRLNSVHEAKVDILFGQHTACFHSRIHSLEIEPWQLKACILAPTDHLADAHDLFTFDDERHPV